MSRPADLPPEAAFPHGTRARYKSGCRCEPCRAANTAAYHERQRLALEAALASPPAPPAGPQAQQWTAPDGTKRTRVYKTTCPGLDGKPCPTGTYLRKDSQGGICANCRSRLVWNGLVDAGRARRHLRRLSRKGIGRRSVAAASDVALTVLEEITRGRKTRIRAKTERRILAVDEGARTDGTLVPAGRTWQVLGWLLEEGFTKGGLAQRLGRKRAALQFRRGMVRARTELEVERLWRQVGEVPPDPQAARK